MSSSSEPRSRFTQEDIAEVIRLKNEGKSMDDVFSALVTSGLGQQPALTATEQGFWKGSTKEQQQVISDWAIQMKKEINKFKAPVAQSAIQGMQAFGEKAVFFGAKGGKKTLKKRKGKKHRKGSRKHK